MPPTPCTVQEPPINIKHILETIIAFFISAQRKPAPQEALAVTIVEIQLTNEDLVRMTFPEQPDLMVAISKCESGIKQFKADGSVVVSPTHDYGIMQVNKKTWHETSIKMGLDYQNNIHDNLKLARHIYEVQGVTAWVCYQNMVK